MAIIIENKTKCRLFGLDIALKINNTLFERKLLMTDLRRAWLQMIDPLESYMV